MSVRVPSLPASPSVRPTVIDVRRLFQTPTTSVAGPSSLPAPSAPATPSPCPSPTPNPNTPSSSSHTSTPPQHGRRSQVSRNRFNAELSQCLLDFVVQLLPTAEELRIKEDVRKLLERLIRTIEPNSRLLSFGSTANGFALRNSDMDLCCLIDSDQRTNATDLVSVLGSLLERETKFSVKPLPYARIPIVKLSLDPSPGLPQGIACDIGFENKLALENTRFLMCYAMIDPARVRTMVLFLKVWSKRRKINSPYRGTMSSYGYVLMVLYFLTHVKNPPVLPNLQQIPPLRPMPVEDMQLNGHNIWFFDDIELLRQRWQSQNTETVAELLADFFKYYSREFQYNTAVISLRAGAMRKEVKGWQSLTPRGKYEDPRERNRFCIEDPFEVDFNVARCVSKDGLYLIRGELMRAHRVFQARPDRAIVALAQLCEERPQEELPPLGAVSFIPPRPPPQTPYTVGGSSMRPQVVPVSIAEEPSVTAKDGQVTEPNTAQTHAELGAPTSDQIAAAVAASVRGDKQPSSLPPDHMAPRRSQYTSPPPPDAPLADFVSFEDMLDQGLSMATAATEARERERDRDRAGETSASASEIFTDDGRISDVADMDDVRSVRSFSEESSTNAQWSPQPPLLQAPSMGYSYSSDASIIDTRKLPGSPLSTGWRPQKSGPSLRVASFRGRRNASGKDDAQDAPSPTSGSEHTDSAEWAAAGTSARRSISGPPKAFTPHRYSMTAADGYTPIHPFVLHRAPLLHPSQANPHSASTVFYETGSSKDRSPVSGSGSNSPIAMPASPAAAYAAAAAVANARPYPTMLPYPTPLYPHHLMDPRMFAYSTAAAVAAAASVPTVSALEAAAIPASFARWGVSPHEHLAATAAVATVENGSGSGARQRAGSGPKTPTPGASANGGNLRRKGSHSHSHSTATVVPASDSPRLRLPKPDHAGSESKSPERKGGRKGTQSSSRSRSRKSTANGNSSGTSETVETPKQEDPSASSPAQSQALLTPDRWFPVSRRADSPHSLETDSPAPSSPASSHYVTSPSTSPPSPATLEPKLSSPPLDERAAETPVAENKSVALADPGSAENTPVGSSFAQVPTTLS